jgi:hypothetical protein
VTTQSWCVSRNATRPATGSTAGSSSCLPRFLEHLDLHGWEGTRRWANADRDLRVGARYEFGGHVELTWTLKPWRGQNGDWSASVVTWLDTGAAKDAFVGALWQFLTADGHPVDYYESDEYFE